MAASHLCPGSPEHHPSRRSPALAHLVLPPEHKFCRVCGITSFYHLRSNPNGIAITVACVDPGTLAHVEYRKADGRNWEEWFQRGDISEFSKQAAAE